MNNLKIFIELTRLNKPIGIMLLFWPCSWGLAYGYLENQNMKLFTYYLILFFLGSILMRSAGCIFNDIIDRDFDKRVKRTKKRPIAAGKISIKQSFAYVLVLCFLAFLILIQFNFLTIMLGMSSMLLAFSYPFMKRITYWPQLFLGITFNWGIVMGWVATNNYMSMEIIVLYIAAIFWTLGYDTIYGAQDMSDDEIIGLKSTSIKFKKNIKSFIASSYTITTLIVLYLFKNFFGLNIFSLLIAIFILSFVYQLVKFKNNQSKNYLNIFKSNNYSGLLLFLAIISINF
jgi:4-hydroxybenzoate polyprenyltransferase